MKDIIEQLVQQELDELVKQTTLKAAKQFIIELIKNNPRTLGKLNTENNNINNMNDENKPTIQELENQLIDLQKKILEEKEKEQLKNQQDNFKVGDYVVCIRSDSTELTNEYVYQISHFKNSPYNKEESWVCLLGVLSFSFGFYRNRFRLANANEVVEELNKISYGEYVVCINSSDADLKNNTVYKVEGVRLGNSSSYFKIKGIEWMISRFRKALPSEVEEFNKNELGNFIAGDYVTALDTCFGFITGKIYIVDNIDCNYINVLKDEDGRENGWHKSHFRRSTQDEIEQYKREKVKAERQKLIDDIKIGDYIKILSSKGWIFIEGEIHQVDNFSEDFCGKYFKFNNLEKTGVYYKDICTKYRKATEDEVKEFLNKNMPKFKKGDYVVALKSSGYGFVKENHVYKVNSVSDPYVNCVDYNGNVNNWRSEFFRLADEKEIRSFKRHVREKEYEEYAKVVSVIKPGDYVVYENNFADISGKTDLIEGKVYMVNGNCSDGTIYIENGYWNKTRFRLATQEEITNNKRRILQIEHDEYEKTVMDIKSGDYIIYENKFEELSGLTELIKGQIYQVEDAQREHRTIYVNHDYYMKSRFRRATQEEINKFQISKLSKGDYVVALDDASGGSTRKGQVYKVLKVENNHVTFLDPNSFCGENGWGVEHFRVATEEEINKHLDPKFEIGDYVIHTESKNLFKIKAVQDKHIVLEGYPFEYLAKYYEKASDYTIKQHLIEQAKKKGFDIGVRVKHIDSVTSFIIEEFVFHPTSKSFPSLAFVSTKNILSIRGKSKTGSIKESEVYDELVIVKDEEIEVNGYKAEYFKDYIKFGCATIDIVMLENLHEWYQSKRNGNRTLTGDIQIGAGTFNKEIIEKLLFVHKNHVFPFN